MSPRQKQTVRSKQHGPQSVHFSRFDGLNTGEPRDKIKATEMSAAVNIDLDRPGYPTVRPGRTLAIAGKWHSMSPTGIPDVLAVLNGDLYVLDPENGTSSVIRYGVGNNKMSYATDGIYTFYSNGSVIGYVLNGVDYQFAAPTRNQKMPPLPGQVVAFLNACLYICTGNEIQVTTPGIYNEVDEIYGIFALPAEITFLAAVDDGLWIGTTDGIYYADGGTLEESTLRKVSEFVNRSGAYVYIDSRKFGVRKADNQYGKTIIFLTDNGVCHATNGGIFGNITGRKYIMPPCNKGAGLFRSGDNNRVIFSVQ